MGERRRRLGKWTRRFVFATGAAGLAVSCGKSVRRTGGDDDAGSAGGPDGAGGSGNGLGGAMGGRGGSGGTGGRPGTTPTGGSGGTTGGASTGGSSGAAGCTDPGAAGDPFSVCPSMVSGDQPRSSCTFEATCETLGCGHPWSQFDLSGCRRRECTSQPDCPLDHRCLPAVLAGVTNCYSSVYEECESDCGECSCTASSDCAPVAFCQPTKNFPPENDCPVGAIDCENLGYFRTLVEIYVEQSYADDLTFSLQACLDAIEERFDDCRGGGGAPGL